MSVSKNLHEAKRWQQTAQDDLQAAKALYKAKMYARACYGVEDAQMAIERASFFLTQTRKLLPEK